MSGAGGNDGMAAEVVRRIAEAVAAEDGPTVVALLADPEAPEASWRQAGRLCDAVAERRKTLVANLAGAGSGFDGFLGAEAGDGLEGVRSGRIKLSEAPVQVEGRRFLYLPAGRQDPASREGGDASGGAPSGQETDPPLADARVIGAVEKLAEKIREAGGALLLYLTPDALPDRRAADLMDGAVRLAGAVGVGGVRTLARVDVGRGGPDETVEDFLGLPTEPEGEGAPGGPAGGSGAPTEAPDAPKGVGDAPERPPPPEPPERDEAAARATPPAELEEGTRAIEAEPAGDEEPTVERQPADVPGATGAGEPRTSPPGREPTREAADAEPRSDPEERSPGRIASGFGGEGGEGGEGGDGGDGGGAAWRRHRRRAGVPWGRILLAVALVAGLAAGWWYLAERATPDAAGDAAPAAAERGVAAAAGADGGVGSPGEDAPPADAGGGTASGEAADGPALVERSPELGYSVLVASYASWSAARERLDRWSAEDGAPVVFVAPTPVGGRVYWRVFAGALADREEGAALNRRLVDRGWKDEATEWEVRPISLAFRLSVHEGREVAGARVSELRARDLPAYVLPAAAEGDTAWAVWAGAYESRESAAELGRRLRRAGVGAALVTRRGATGGT